MGHRYTDVLMIMLLPMLVGPFSGVCFQLFFCMWPECKQTLVSMRVKQLSHGFATQVRYQSQGGVDHAVCSRWLLTRCGEVIRGVVGQGDERYSEVG